MRVSQASILNRKTEATFRLLITDDALGINFFPKFKNKLSLPANEV